MSLLFILTVFLVSSCSKEGQFEKRMEGSWNADKYEGEGDDDGSGKKGNVTTASFNSSNAGELTFDDDGTGTYNYDYDVVIEGDLVVGSGSVTITIKSAGEFEWESGDASITITYTSGGRKGDKATLNVNTNDQKRQEWSGEAKQSYTVDGSTNSFDMELVMELSKQ